MIIFYFFKFFIKKLSNSNDDNFIELILNENEMNEIYSIIDNYFLLI